MMHGTINIKRSSFTFFFEGQANQQVLLTMRCSSRSVHNNNKTPTYFRHTQLQIILKRDFRLPPQSRWKMRFSEILCNVALISQKSADLIQFIILSICSLMDALLQAEICRLFWTTESCENCALLRCYSASSENFLATFRDNLSVPYSGAANPWILNPWRRDDRLFLKRHYSLRNNPEGCSSHLLRGGSLKSHKMQRCVRLHYIRILISIQQE